MFRQPRLNKRGRGSVMTECVIVLPLLILLTAGVIDLGLGISGAIAVSTATRDLARSAAVFQPPPASPLPDHLDPRLATLISLELGNEPRLTNVRVTNTAPFSSSPLSPCDQKITVSVAAEYRSILMGVLGLGSVFPLGSSVSMRYNNWTVCN